MSNFRPGDIVVWENHWHKDKSLTIGIILKTQTTFDGNRFDIFWIFSEVLADANRFNRSDHYHPYQEFYLRKLKDLNL